MKYMFGSHPGRQGRHRHTGSLPAWLAPALPIALSLIAVPSATATFPGPNGKLAFVSTRDNAAGEIYTMRLNRKDLTRLTANGSVDSEPAWSPDGSKLAFISNIDGGPDEFSIYSMTADGSQQTRLTTTNDFDPAWSPDGSKLAFTSYRDGNSEIYTMDADGTGAQNLTHEAAGDATPDWSPDGTKLVFVSMRDGNEELYTMNADGTDVRRLTINNVPDFQPSWSPDGSKLAFVSLRDASIDIYAMDTSTGSVTRLTRTEQGAFAPVWSPSGTMLAFQDSVIQGTYITPQIFTMNADGSDATVLTAFGGSFTYSVAPDWQRGVAPTATFTASPASAQIGEAVVFDASASADRDGAITQYRWDLDGDGAFETNTGTGASAARFYPSPGQVAVTLRVTDSDGNTSDATQALSIRARPPSAVFDVFPNPAVIGQPVTFDGRGSSDPDGVITDYRWDLDGNGSYETDTGQTPIVTRSYAAPATVSVKLRVTDNHGAANDVSALSGEPLRVLPDVIESEATLAYTGTRRGIRIRSVTLRDVPSGARIEIGCRHGRPRLCAPRVQKASLPTREARAAVTMRLRGLRNKQMRSGTLLELRITKQSHIGKYIGYKITAGGFTKIERCLSPGSRIPRRTCA